MHLTTIAAFAFLFWQAEDPGRWVLVRQDDVAWTWAAVLFQPLLAAIASIFITRRAAWLLRRYPEAPEVAHHFHHRATAVLRTSLCLLFAGTVFLTRWPLWFSFEPVDPALQIVGDVIVLTPFLASVVLVWIASYPLEQPPQAADDVRDRPPTWPRWRFWAYLDFHVRHHILIVAVPMIFILFAANMTRGYETVLLELTGWEWTPDFVLGAVAVVVFVLAPWMLRRIWRTTPLQPGPVRERLESLCRRIGLRFSEILVWQSDGMLINAAVMGVLAPLRYVLLSDALLATMNVRQVEAVFGHETGHVRHRHMQYFLLFAFVGWLAFIAIMELLARAMEGSETVAAGAVWIIDGVGIVATAVLWILGFGWLSRRFERQADVFAARCVSPPVAECRLPCSVHPDSTRTIEEGRLCATGVAVFASALDQVAVLNGIPHEERSWRHSSIASRLRFLRSLAGDPRRVRRFETELRQVKVLLVVAALVGTVTWICYWQAVSEPAILRLQLGGP